MLNPPAFRLSLLALACTCSYLAAEADPRFGVQAALALPQRDLKAWAGPGFGIGFHEMIDMGQGEAFRPRLDYQVFRGHPTLSVPVGGGPAMETHGMANIFSIVTVGVDSLYFFSGETDIGAYLLAGLGLSYNKLDSQVDGGPAAPGAEWPEAGTSHFESARKATLSAGFGYQFDRARGAELRVSWGRAQYGAVNLKLNAVSLAFTYQF